MAITPAGDVFITDGYGNRRIVHYDKAGNFVKDKSNPDFTNLRPGEAVGVHAIGQDSRGNLFVGEIYSRRAQKFSMATR